MISFDLTGKVAVVTGASSGLGQQFAKSISEQGCDVAILARRKERLEEFSKELKQNGHDCLPVSCDVTDEESIKNAVNGCRRSFWKNWIFLSIMLVLLNTLVVFMIIQQPNG